MRIIITDIHAEIIDVSTLSKDNYLIGRWIVKYEVIFSKPSYDETPGDSVRYRLDTIKGNLSYDKFPSIDDILNYLKERYDKVSLHN